MYVVVETGGRQYKVAAGDIIQVEKLEGAQGDKVELHTLHLLQDANGALLSGGQLKSAKVVAEIMGQGRDKKVLVFKKKRRKNYRRTQGHRQSFTRIKIAEIVA